MFPQLYVKTKSVKLVAHDDVVSFDSEYIILYIGSIIQLWLIVN